MNKMNKRKCPICNSTRLIENENYISCDKCNWVHKKTEREKKNG